MVTIRREDLDVLRDPAFDIPKAREPGDLATFLAEQNSLFFEMIARFGGSLADRLAERAYWMRELASTLEAVPVRTKKGEQDRAWQLMEDILDEHLGALKTISLRHAYKVMGSQSWYRLTAWSEAKARRDIFHMPFDLPAGSYRFTPPGRPALYLGNNVYVCYLECQAEQPLALESCRVARFEIDVRDDEYFLNLPTNHAAYLSPIDTTASLQQVVDLDPTRVTNSPYLDDVEGELVDYLALWPLLMAMTVQKLQPAPKHPPEYVIPQLLMRWVMKQKNLLGIRYFTSKFDPATNTQDLSINVVLPTRSVGKTSGFDDFLVERAHCTVPQTFAEAASLPDELLFTKEAAGERDAASGRYMIHWKGSIQDYQATPFGRMEYWLDRRELPVARIDAA
jgi:hypothetical protein